MAVGVESGRISIFAGPHGQPSGCALLHTLDEECVHAVPKQLLTFSSLGHTGPVHRLAFRPRDSASLHLASAGADHAVRILVLQL